MTIIYVFFDLYEITSLWYLVEARKSLVKLEQARVDKREFVYKMKVIPNKECILIIHKFELNCIFRIKSDSSSAEFARYDICNLIRNIQFNSNLCIISTHSLFGITFILYWPKLSAGRGQLVWEFSQLSCPGQTRARVAFLPTGNVHR